MRTVILACLAAPLLVACGGDDTSTPIDAPAPDGEGLMDAPIDAAGQAQTCASYCALIGGNCTAANQQYPDTTACMATCMHIAPGTAADTSGNTLGCRIYHADAAGANPGLHCRHAGPGGDGACGANCAGFCTLVMAACAGQATQPYPDMNTCLASCNGFAVTPTYSTSTTSGNSLACRLYHAVAASTAPGIHCPHTAATSATCQ